MHDFKEYEIYCTMEGEGLTLEKSPQYLQNYIKGHFLANRTLLLLKCGFKVGQKLCVASLQWQEHWFECVLLDEDDQGEIKKVIYKNISKSWVNEHTRLIEGEQTQQLLMEDSGTILHEVKDFWSMDNVHKPEG